MAALNELEIRLIVKSEVDKEFKKAGEAAKKFEEDAGKSVKKVSKGFGNLKTAIEAAMAGAVLRGGANLIKSSEKMGLALSILKVKNEDVYNQLLKTEEATFGLANKFDMVTAANKALAFGIDLSDGKLGSLMKISTKLAAVMGIEVKQAFDDLIVSSARQQKLIADNLGIMIDKVKVDQAYADQLGITARALTEQQQSQAFLNEILKKGSVITKELSDDFVRAGTQGTAALKRIETGAVTALNATAQAFVYLTEAVAVSSAMSYKEFNKNWIAGFKIITGTVREAEGEYEAYVKRLKDLDKNRSLAYEHIQKQYVQADQKTVIQNYETWFKYYKAKQRLDEVAAAQVEKEKERVARLMRFRDTILGATFTAAKLSEKLFDGFVNNEEVRLFKHGKKQAKEKIRREKAGAREALRIREDLVSDIIDAERAAIDESKLTYVEKLNLETEFAAKEKELVKRGVEELTEHRMALAVEADGLVKVNKLTRLQNDYRDFLNETKNLDDEITAEVIAQKKRESDKIASIDKKNLDKKLKRHEKHFNTLKSYGDEYLQAVLQGNIDMIPKILAQQAMRIGTEMIWDGTKGVWKGIVKNAEAPGSGVPLMTAGFGEIAAGGVIAAAGGVASNMLSKDGSGSDSGAKERNDTSSKEQVINMNVVSSLYGSKMQAKREIIRIVR